MGETSVSRSLDRKRFLVAIADVVDVKASSIMSRAEVRSSAVASGLERTAPTASLEDAGRSAASKRSFSVIFRGEFSV